VELFDARGIATGKLFYVQLKATDAADNSKNRRIKVKANHHRYWNSLNDPVLLALYFAKTQSIYVRWAHRCHPDFRPEMVQRESQFFTFSKSSRWRRGDTKWITDELKNIREVAAGAIHLPLRVGVSSLDEPNVKPSDVTSFLNEVAANTEDSDIRWRPGDDWTDKFHVYISSTKVMARAGKAIFSITKYPVDAADADLQNSPKGDDSDAVQKLLLTDAAICCLSLAVGLGGSPSVGAHLLTRYGTNSPLIQGIAKHNLPLIFMRSRRFDLAMNLIESWLSDRDDVAFEACALLYIFLGTWGITRLSDAERERLNTIGERLGFASFGSTQLYSTQLRLVTEFGGNGYYAEAVNLMEFIVAEYQKQSRQVPTEDLIAASRWAMEVQEYERAEDWLRPLIEQDLIEQDRSDEALSLIIRSFLFQGKYAEAAWCVASASPGNSHAGRMRALGVLLVLILIHVRAGNQNRLPGEVLKLWKELPDEPTAAMLTEAFSSAVKLDAASLTTWSLHFSARLNGAEGLILEPLACFATATLAELDAEWWALACGELFRSGWVRGALYAIEAAIETCPEEFLGLLNEGYPDGDTSKVLGPLADVMKEHKAKSSTFALREADSVPELTLPNLGLKITHAYELVAIEPDGGESVLRLLGLTIPAEDEGLYAMYRTLPDRFREMQAEALESEASKSSS
jgi:hypothetical protein